jgi:hypothetical protein
VWLVPAVFLGVKQKMEKKELQQLDDMLNNYMLNVCKCDEVNCTKCSNFTWKCPDMYCAVRMVQKDIRGRLENEKEEAN